MQTRSYNLWLCLMLVGLLALLPGPALAQGPVNLDPSFDGDGKVTTSFSQYNSQARTVAVQPDGKIIVAGWTTIVAYTDFALASYNPNGSLDTTFDGDGKVVTDFGSRMATWLWPG